MASARLGIANPFFKSQDGVAGATTRMAGREFINFGNYNYLGLSGDPEVSSAAKAAIDQYGTSVSASRIVSGERPLHGQLERDLAELYEVDDAPRICQRPRHQRHHHWLPVWSQRI